MILSYQSQGKPKKQDSSSSSAAAASASAAAASSKKGRDSLTVYVYDPSSRRAEDEIAPYHHTDPAEQRARRQQLAEALCDASNFTWSVPMCAAALKFNQDDPVGQLFEFVLYTRAGPTTGTE
jgi:cobalamin biosynthesis protein CbiD